MGAADATDALAVSDVDGDTDLDMLVGDSGTGTRVLLFNGPITTNPAAGDGFRVYNGAAIGNSIFFADVNGDAPVDMNFVDSAGNPLYSLFGLD